MEEKSKQVDVTLLHNAFEAFNKATEKIQDSYDKLQEEANKLRIEIEEKNKKLSSISTLLEAVLMNSNSGIIAINEKGEILTKNKMFSEFETKFEKELFLNKIVNFRTPGIYEMEFKNNYFRLSVGKLNEEKITGYVYTVDDITEIKNFEIESHRNEKLSLLGEMAANIAHQIRNPLGSIELFASLLSRELKQNPGQYKLANSIIKGVRTINSTISNLLNFTRETKVEIRKYYLTEIIDDVILYLRHLIIEKDIEFINNIDEDDIIYCDKELFKQVIMNLIHNSIEAVSNKGRISISSENTNNETIITIEDNGKGIDENMINNLFMPFQTTKAKGTGLGLSIVYKIVKAHKGNIIPESNGKNFTRFIIKLPK
jgi:two-component system sensor histidine kinase FlrB